MKIHNISKVVALLLVFLGTYTYYVVNWNFEFNLRKYLNYDSFDSFPVLVRDLKPDRHVVYQKLMDAAFSTDKGVSNSALLIIEHLLMDAWSLSEFYGIKPVQMRAEFESYVRELKPNSEQNKAIVNKINLLILEINSDPIYSACVTV